VAAKSTAAAASREAPRALVWLRNDLRTHDNPALAAAAAAVARGEASSVIPFVPFDPRNHGRSTLCGFPKTGNFRAKFRLEAAADLRRRLVALGSGLVVRPQAPEEIVVELLTTASSGKEEEKNNGGGIVFVADEPFSEEREAVEAVQRALSTLPSSPHPSVLRVVEPRGGANTLLHPDDLNFGPGMERLPDLFTAFRTEAEEGWRVRAPVAAPATRALPLPEADADLAAEMTSSALPITRVEDLNPLIRRACEAQGVEPYELKTPDEEELRKLSVMDFKGGETAAYARLNHYLFGSKAASTYFETRNGKSVIGGEERRATGKRERRKKKLQKKTHNFFKKKMETSFKKQECSGPTTRQSSPPGSPRAASPLASSRTRSRSTRARKAPTSRPTGSCSSCCGATSSLSMLASTGRVSLPRRACRGRKVSSGGRVQGPRPLSRRGWKGRRGSLWSMPT